jgi:hypothetical protein
MAMRRRVDAFNHSAPPSHIDAHPLAMIPASKLQLEGDVSTTPPLVGYGVYC